MDDRGQRQCIKKATARRMACAIPSDKMGEDMNQTLAVVAVSRDSRVCGHLGNRWEAPPSVAGTVLLLGPISRRFG